MLPYPRTDDHLFRDRAAEHKCLRCHASKMRRPAPRVN
jgi:hypothetical protein